MKQSLLIFFILLSAFLLTFCHQESASTAATPASKVQLQAQVKRGEYLVTVGGCNDCHSPKIMTPYGPEPDPTRLLSGHPETEVLPVISDKKMLTSGQWVFFNMNSTSATGPWGTSFSANLTPDDTGIGSWTFEQFKKAIREGKSKGLEGTRPLLPPMPWFNFAKMNEEDLEAVFAYLKSLPPVKNNVPKPIPPAS